jgi:hypothetical protein
MLKKGAKGNSAEADGTTALHWAVQHDDERLVRALLTAGAQVRAANRYGVTPLASPQSTAARPSTCLKVAPIRMPLPGRRDGSHGSCALRPARRIKLLLKAGANPNST